MEDARDARLLQRWSTQTRESKDDGAFHRVAGPFVDALSEEERARVEREIARLLHDAGVPDET